VSLLIPYHRLTRTSSPTTASNGIAAFGGGGGSGCENAGTTVKKNKAVIKSLIVTVLAISLQSYFFSQNQFLNESWSAIFHHLQNQHSS
jgi:hypothetical protein